MEPKARLKLLVRQGRKRGALWVRLLDLARAVATSDGRGMLWTRIVYRDGVHQTTSYTCEERYPALFDLAATLAPDAERILSFGCSTGQELVALRRRFRRAHIVGSEINPRSRRIARRRVAVCDHTEVVSPSKVQGIFDVIFALAVLQREPHKIELLGIKDLSSHYPFDHFDGAVRYLSGLLRPGGFLCVTNAQYRVEDSSVAPQLDPVAGCPLVEQRLFGSDGRRLYNAVGHTIFRKKLGQEGPQPRAPEGACRSAAE